LIKETKGRSQGGARAARVENNQFFETGTSAIRFIAPIS